MVAAAPATPLAGSLAPSRSPQGIPVAKGTIRDFLRYIYKPYERMAEVAAEYGDTVRIRQPIPGVPEVIITGDPEALREIWRVDQAKLGPPPGTLEPTFGPASLLVSKGERHTRDRKLMAPAFQGERMRAHASRMRRVADKHLDQWERDGRVVVQDAVGRMGIDVIMEVVLGMDADHAKTAELKQLLWDNLHSFSPASVFIQVRWELFGLTSWGRFMKKKRRADQLLLEEIRRRRRLFVETGEAGDDILSLLIAAVDDDGAPAFTDEDLISHVATLLVAGFETTATTLPWVLHYALRDDNVMAALRAEELERGTTTEALCGAPYLEAVINEAMRLSPTIPEAPRSVLEPFELRGETIAAGTMLVAAVPIAHRRPEAFEDPDAYRPARFVGRRYSPYEFIPFGGGVRKCIGWAFAMQQMKVVLGALFARLDVVAESDDATPVRRNLSVGIASGFPIRVQPRAPAVEHASGAAVADDVEAAKSGGCPFHH